MELLGLLVTHCLHVVGDLLADQSIVLGKTISNENPVAASVPQNSSWLAGLLGGNVLDVVECVLLLLHTRKQLRIRAGEASTQSSTVDISTTME